MDRVRWSDDTYRSVGSRNCSGTNFGKRRYASNHGSGARQFSHPQIVGIQLDQSNADLRVDPAGRCTNSKFFPTFAESDKFLPHNLHWNSQHVTSKFRKWPHSRTDECTRNRAGEGIVWGLHWFHGEWSAATADISNTGRRVPYGPDWWSIQCDRAECEPMDSCNRYCRIPQTVH